MEKRNDFAMKISIWGFPEEKWRIRQAENNYPNFQTIQLVFDRSEMVL